MARELGLNPKKLGGMDNHRQEPWKMPLRQFIEHLYWKRFGKERPDLVLSIEEKVRRDDERKAVKRAAKLLRRQSGAGEPGKPQASALPPLEQPAEDIGRS